MKNKVISIMILVVLILSMCMCISPVEAFSGELDPQKYITMPYSITMENGTGTGTVTLSGEANGFSIAYQKIHITSSQKDTITAKYNELNNYITQFNAAVEQRNANIKKLQDEYNDLLKAQPAEQEKIEKAKKDCEDAETEANNYYNTGKAKINELQNNVYELIPSYTNNWTNTTNSADNIKLDFSGYSGEISIVLWVKISKASETYYDMQLYTTDLGDVETITLDRTSAEIRVDDTLQLTATSSKDTNITWTSSDSTVATVTENGLVKGIKEGTTVITAKGIERTATCNITVKSKDAVIDNGEWTDFSKAEFELSKEGVSDASIQISNVTAKEKSSYYMVITPNANEASIPSKGALSDESISLKYDAENKKFVTVNISKVANYVELNQDIYVNIIERNSSGQEKVVFHGKKLEKYEEPKYADAFHATFMTKDTDQLVTCFTHFEKNNRKIQIKIGKITDQSILQKIKNNDISGFASLLDFAKKSNGIFDKVVDADKDDYFAIEYNADSEENRKNQEVINLNNIEDGAYYYLYVKADGENGKYTSPEAVTLAEGNVRSNSWGLFFYGSSDFKWADFGDAGVDNTTANGKIPQTGANMMIWASLGLALIGGGAFSYIQYRRNNYK